MANAGDRVICGVAESHHYISLLQTSLKIKDPFSTKSIHAQIIKSGLHLGLFVVNNLINVYAKLGYTSDASKVFDELPVKNISSWNTILSAYTRGGMISEAVSFFNKMPDRDSVSWTTMIVSYNRSGFWDDALRLFSKMVSSQVLPNQYTFTNVLGSCGAIRELDVGKMVHSFVIKLGFVDNVAVANSLLNMYAKSRSANAAKMVFESIPLKDVSSWNGMISLHMQSGEVDLALTLFEQMKERDIVSWNLLITGCNQHGFDVKALEIFSTMLKDTKIIPDRYALASALSACASTKNVSVGRQIHGHIVRTSFNTSGAVGNALICMYSRCGCVENAHRIVIQTGRSNLNVIAFTALLDGYVKLGDINPARQIFDSLAERDVVVWTAMLVGYVQNGSHNEAMALFRLMMIRDGEKPNSYTLAAILSSISSLASLNHGKQIHAVAIRILEASPASLDNALINMYAKAGNILYAKKIFSLSHQRKDAISWTSMIIALAQHGLAKEAIHLFENMLECDSKPDHITYVGVFSACTHAGLVEDGRRYYKMMQEVHDIVPTSSHCACMIDLLGRAGLLHEALEFIEKMPVEPDAIAWGSLLAACKIHKNAELAKVAAENLLKIDPDNGGAYSALANAYSACGRWREAAGVRKSMKLKQVKKEQGFSWIQIKNEVHAFGVEDGLHPQRDAIYQLMEKIWKEIKKMGYIPDTDSVLHDLDPELKEQILKHHSEKLAIAFGLLNTPENATLRIMKNLRVCNDCHSAIKFISKLVNREIILRDATRFHHFQGGVCSCRDYW
ncbi:OLC1v1002876C1 [Oldenlandia corymbosa var. corymbosa]|uniref:OLC1v1002876C1 n=1 Tax=Oldenlandia corymbosa var. corymbosa TaxID=529605 RepID=A0AAV1DB66_OLDCO|nr:OLC1v1002876C1 [Oldenlandia corymbosa var. corymbosa]